MQEDEQVFGQAQARGVIPFYEKLSSRASADMQIDVPSLVVGAPPRSSSAKRNILLEEKHLKLRNKTEKDAFKQLKI